MGRVARFIHLTSTQRWLLVKAASLLAVVRLSLRIFPFPAVRPLLAQAGRNSPRLVASALPPHEVAWAVDVAGRIIPGGSHCLSQALTLQTLLARRGCPSTVCFGVQRNPGAPLMAHAWVEHEGRVLIGGGHLDRFVRLSAP